MRRTIIGRALAWGASFPFLKKLYLTGLAMVKLPRLGALDYLANLWSRDHGSNEFLTIRLGGSVSLKLRRNGTDIKIFQQIFLLEDCKLPTKELRPEAIIDGGAHIGCASVYYALKYPEAKILAVEAEPGNAAMLRENVKCLPHVEAIHAAIFDRAGFVALENPQGEAWEFRVKSNGKEVQDSASRIPTVTMDDLVARFDGKRVDLIKLDIEGAEIEVFSRGSQKWLGSVKTIVVELHDRFRPGCSEAFESAVSRYQSETRRTVHNVVWTNLQI